MLERGPEGGKCRSEQGKNLSEKVDSYSQDLETFADPFAVDGSWPTLTQGLPVQAALGPDLHDFVVDELPAYPCSGNGEHLFVHVQKSGLSTMQVVGRLSQACGIPDREVGFAGRKDARGLTSQYFSVPRRCEARVQGIVDAAVQVLAMTAHDNKLRLGHLAGNHFKVRLELAADQNKSLVRERLDSISAQGLPDYYGPQRFGPGLGSAVQGLQALHKGRLERRGRAGEFLISAAQSLLFNDYLGQRMKQGTLFVALPGELLKTARGGLFTCEDPATDTGRVARGEIVPTGPMFGRKMMPVRGAALTLESEILRSRGLSSDQFLAMRPPIPGTRRALLARVTDASIVEQERALLLEFSLPPGSYASELCRELCRIPFTW